MLGNPSILQGNPMIHNLLLGVAPEDVVGHHPQARAPPALRQRDAVPQGPEKLLGDEVHRVAAAPRDLGGFKGSATKGQFRKCGLTGLVVQIMKPKSQNYAVAASPYYRVAAELPAEGRAGHREGLPRVRGRRSVGRAAADADAADAPWVALFA